MHSPSPVIHSNQRLTRRTIVAALLVALASCTDTPLPTIGNDAQLVNSPPAAVAARLARERISRSAVRKPSRALASATTTAACPNILVYDNNTNYQHAQNAVTGMGLEYTRAVSGDFVTLLTGGTWNVVVMDLPSNEPDGDWQASLITYIQAGGRVVHSHWNPESLTAPLQAAFEIANAGAHETVSFYQWNSHALFTAPNSVPGTFDTWSDVWGTNGFYVEPTGSAVAAAGNTTEPTARQAAIVIGNGGRTIFNGLLFDDFNPQDNDEDGQKDIEELIQNEIESVCGFSSDETTQPVDRGEPATVTVKEDGKAVAGIDIPTGTFAEDVVVTVKFEDLAADESCHDYLMGQLTGKCLTVTAEGADGPATLHQTVTIGFCLESHLQYELMKFETKTGRAIPLPQRAVPFLDCTDFHLGSAAPSNWLQGLAMRVGNVFTPKSAYAADMGFGGDVLPDLGLSSFTWTPYIGVSNAGLALNVFNRGKDAFGVIGTFGMEAKGFEPNPTESGFNPAAHEVTVAYGDFVQTIGVNKFKWVQFLRRYVYIKAVAPGISYMDIDPVSGGYTIIGSATAEGDALPTSRAFTVQIGHRTRGVLLLCGTDNRCHGQHPHAP